MIEELVVTAQKREESIQDVPIAVSAYGETALAARRIDGAQNLAESVPNLSFTRRAGRPNFQIRGVGSQVAAVTGDDGVGIHHNNVPLTTNRAADADFYDVERVEVLRGPQGTLYGRNATGGVVNVITNKPTDEFGASITAEATNYNGRKFTGFLNVPIGEMLDLRVAGFALDRDGFMTNTLTGADLDNREILSSRVSLAFRPSDDFQASFVWENFSEDDSRGSTTRKALCIKDAGPTSILGTPTGPAQAVFTRGCLPGSVYDPASYGTTNQLVTFPGLFGRAIGLQTVDSFLNKTTSRDLREIEVSGTPIYRPRSDLYELNLEWQMTPSLTVTSLTSYNENEFYSRGDTTTGRASVPFPDSPVAPGGLLNDPQLGLTDRLAFESGNTSHSEQWSQELRIQSSFDGPFNFNVGAIYLDYDNDTVAGVWANAATLAARLVAPASYIDPLRDPDFTGHNYYTSWEIYRLTSKALFGEAYWELTPDLRATLGLRYTDDKKTYRGSTPLFTPGRGPNYSPEREVSFKEVTGRFNLDWTPDLAFTDKTLIYASYSRGYKAGGFNGSGVIALGLNSAYRPEFVNAVEVGAKNTLLDGTMNLNLTAFYYSYKDYQVARSVNRAAYNENIDTALYGVELESLWRPTNALQLNANIGYLRTEVKEGLLVDTFYRDQGDATYVYGNSPSGGCIVNAAGVAALMQTAAGMGALANNITEGPCGGPAALTAGLVARGMSPAQAAALSGGVYTYGANVTRLANGAGEGVLQDLKGAELPNAPRWTVSFGAQYTWDVSQNWNLTVRGDYSWQAKAWARLNNAFFDRINSWDNLNATATFENEDQGLRVQAFVRNVFNNDTILGYEIVDENLGQYRNLILADPRLYGISVTKTF